ncbi:MAG: hypothetical protein IH945_10790, partial [Armatimonadetes bacterium]|nr:hypothetical protein [Armatimonadota bacterium]
LSSVGLPGLNGFVGEFLALLGAFEVGVTGQFGLGWWLPLTAGAGVILAAVYLLWMYQKVFYGPVTNPVLARIKDLKTWEVVTVGSLVLFAFWGGLYPATFLRPMEKSIAALRHMASNEEGQRPTWDDHTLEIETDGSLVRVEPGRAATSMDTYTVVETVAPANLHHEIPTGMTVARGTAE